MADNKYFIEKSFRSYLIPSVLSILGGNISILIDNCIAGAFLGEKALAAMSIVNPVFNIITSAGLLIFGGASTLASISIGNSDIEKKNLYFSLSFYLAVIVGVVITIAGLITLSPLIRVLGASGELALYARDYCRVMFLGSFALIVIYFPLNFFRIEGMARMGMRMFLIMSVLDILLDLMLVVVLPLGMTGMALATVISAIVAVAAVCPKLFAAQTGYRFVQPGNCRMEIRQIMMKGSPLALGNLYTVIRVRVLNSLLLSSGGSLALASYVCANNVNIVGMALITGISQTVAPITGVLFGERDGAGIKRIARKASTTGMAVTLGFWLVLMVFREPLALLFGMTTPRQMEAAQTAIMILSANLIFVMFSCVLISCYMTCDHTGVANLLTISRGLVCALAFCVVGSRLFGTTGVLGGLVLAEIATLILALATTAWMRRHNTDYDGILLLSRKRFQEGISMTHSVLNTSESISKAAALTATFCEEQGLAPKRVMAVSLGVEEIMVLMSKYALTGQDEHIGLRLVISSEETVTRIRCGGKWFNPLTFKAEDELDYMGIKMLLRMAQDVSYSTNLGFNNIKVII